VAAIAEFTQQQLLVAADTRVENTDVQAFSPRCMRRSNAGASFARRTVPTPIALLPPVLFEFRGLL
jgi:hypothetical protein